MPCNCDYMEQNADEKWRQETARLYVYVCGLVGITPLPNIVALADDIYAKDVGQGELICDMLRALPDWKRERIVYNAKDPNSRKLADWWEEHQKHDKRRGSGR